MRLSLIPARGGSKRVPGKNIRPFNGSPLIAYSIEHSCAAGFDLVLVTTDQGSIGAVAREHGAEVIMRSSQLAGDTSPTMEAVRHALETLAAKGRPCGYVAVLQPPCPLCGPSMVREAPFATP